MLNVPIDLGKILLVLRLRNMRKKRYELVRTTFVGKKNNEIYEKENLGLIVEYVIVKKNISTGI